MAYPDTYKPPVKTHLTKNLSETLAEGKTDIFTESAENRQELMREIFNTINQNTSLPIIGENVILRDGEMDGIGNVSASSETVTLVSNTAITGNKNGYSYLHRNVTIDGKKINKIYVKVRVDGGKEGYIALEHIGKVAAAAPAPAAAAPAPAPKPAPAAPPTAAPAAVPAAAPAAPKPAATATPTAAAPAAPTAPTPAAAPAAAPAVDSKIPKLANDLPEKADAEIRKDWGSINGCSMKEPYTAVSGRKYIKTDDGIFYNSKPDKKNTYGKIDQDKITYVLHDEKMQIMEGIDGYTRVNGGPGDEKNYYHFKLTDGTLVNQEGNPLEKYGEIWKDGLAFYTDNGEECDEKGQTLKLERDRLVDKLKTSFLEFHYHEKSGMLDLKGGFHASKTNGHIKVPYELVFESGEIKAEEREGGKYITVDEYLKMLNGASQQLEIVTSIIKKYNTDTEKMELEDITKYQTTNSYFTQLEQQTDALMELETNYGGSEYNVEYFLNQIVWRSVENTDINLKEKYLTALQSRKFHVIETLDTLMRYFDMKKDIPSAKIWAQKYLEHSECDNSENTSNKEKAQNIMEQAYAPAPTAAPAAAPTAPAAAPTAPPAPPAAPAKTIEKREFSDEFSKAITKDGKKQKAENFGSVFNFDGTELTPKEYEYLDRLGNKFDGTLWMGNLTNFDSTKIPNLASKVTSLNANKATELDVKENTALTVLYANAATTLDVSKNTALTHLSADAATELDVSKNTALTSLYADAATVLDVKENTALTFLSADAATELDVSQNKALTFLSAKNLTTPISLDIFTAQGDMELWITSVGKFKTISEIEVAGEKIDTINLGNYVYVGGEVRVKSSQ